jgi:hypothetical protein
MKTALVTTLQESCGYLQDGGWHQTAQLMRLAANEIDRLTERVHELETERDTLHGAASTGAIRTPQASNRNGVRIAAAASRR